MKTIVKDTTAGTSPGSRTYNFTVLATPEYMTKLIVINTRKWNDGIYVVESRYIYFR